MAADASAPTLANRFQRPSVIGLIGLVVVLGAVALMLKNLTVSPSRFFEVTLIGLTTGCVYALVALGYTLVYGILELINFAHGDVFMLGGMFTITISTHLFNLHTGQGFAIVPIVFATLILSMLACGVLNATIEFIAYRPLRRAPRLAPLITAIGVSFIIEDVGLLLGAELRDGARRLPAHQGLLVPRRRLRLEQADRRRDHDPGAARAALPRAADAPGQGDARDRAGQGRRRDDGHQRQPDDLVHVPDRRRARRRRRPSSTRST